MGLLYVEGEREVRIVMVGLDNVGKTTILQRLNMIPHVGFYGETVKYMNLRLNVLNLDGQNHIHPIQRQYMFGTDALIYVVDSSDPDRLAVARDELHSLMAEVELSDAVLMVAANKQDLVNAVHETELTKALGLWSISNHWWVVQGCSAKNGTGLIQGIECLTRMLKN